MSNQNNSKKYLVVGATSGTGIHLVNQLLERNLEVGIVVRNTNKAKDLFAINKISKVVEHEFGVTINNTELTKAIEWCDIIISNLGSVYGGNPQLSDYESHKLLITLAEKYENKKYVMISSLFITRPYNYVAFIINSILPYCYGWKALAENELRRSKLDYLIVRPGRLMDTSSSKDKSKVFEPVLFNQGDRIKGKISRDNLSNTILNLLTDNLDWYGFPPKNVYSETIIYNESMNYFIGASSNELSKFLYDRETSIVSEYEEEIIISPNPTNGSINISFTNKHSSSFQYELISNSGQIVQTAAMGYLQLAANSINLDISSIANGNYILRVFSLQEEFVFNVIKEG